MNKLSYEEASKELNEIIKKVENGDVSVSETITLIERGKILLDTCYKELEKANGKLTEIKETLGKIEEI